MEKVLLLSVIVSMVVLPIRAARVADPNRALRKLFVQVLTFNLLYWVAVVFVWFTFIHGGDPRALLHPVNNG